MLQVSCNMQDLTPTARGPGIRPGLEAFCRSETTRPSARLQSARLPWVPLP